MFAQKLRKAASEKRCVEQIVGSLSKRLQCLPQLQWFCQTFKISSDPVALSPRSLATRSLISAEAYGSPGPPTLHTELYSP